MIANKYCGNCKLPFQFCYCKWINPIANQTKVSLIIHHRERYLTSNTGLLADKILLNSSVYFRGLIEPTKKVINFDSGLESFLYLYPDEEAFPLNQDFLSTLKRPIHLIVPDGSWRQARKIKRRELKAFNIPSVSVSSEGPSKYLLRKQIKTSRMCTLEALAMALGIIEGPKIQEYLMDGLEKMVWSILRSKNQRDFMEKSFALS